MKALEMIQLAVDQIHGVALARGADFTKHDAKESVGAEFLLDREERIVSIKSSDGTEIRTYSIKIELIYVE